jgi:geranylgeranyl reductase family protein
VHVVDVVIVGAGPAGSWTAYCLARRGVRVTIVDGSHPREKPCGGGVTGRALGIVADALDGEALPATVIRTARFTNSARGASAVVPLAALGIGPSSDLVVANRAEFDRRLLEAACRAGATLTAARVTDVAVVHDGVSVQTTTGVIRADVVIGADGTNSLVRRRVAAPFRRDQLSIATGYFAHGVTSDEITIELVGEPPGYIWSFPRPTHLAIGICARADAGLTASRLRATAAEWIDATRLAGGARLEPYSWPIPSLSGADFGGLTLAGPRWLLVGDAAGLVDPITREGIYFALRSGELAADALCSERTAAQHYRDSVSDEMANELARAARLHAHFFEPRFTRLLMDALLTSAGIRAVMADLVAGGQGYKGLRWRLARTGEIGLACRWLVVQSSLAVHTMLRE